MKRIALAALLAWLAAACWAASPDEARIASGKGSFLYAGDVGHAIRVWTYRPENLSPDSPIVFVMHGAERNARGYRDVWAEPARRHGFLLLVPEFPAGDYPGEAYQQGNLRDRAGQALPPQDWTFTLIETLFDEAKRLTANRSERYYLYGHSAGGQFVHRLVLFMPQARYARAIAANPGYYTFPTTQTRYPYGLKDTPLSDGMDATVFGRDFVLLLGAQDIRRDQSDFRKTAAADAQGRTRLERGQHYFQAASEAAAQRNAPFQWRQVIVPGVGHSNAGMAPAAVMELFAAPGQAR